MARDASLNAPMILPDGSLENAFVRLEPLSAEHEADVVAIVRRNPESFRFWLHRHDGDWAPGWFAHFREASEAGSIHGYAVRRQTDGEVVGFTAFLAPNAEQRTVEIGSTGYDAPAQGTYVNPACKHLMLRTAFEAGANRVQFNIDARNSRSQQAVLKLGAVREGVMRKHRICGDGYVRDTVVFSIVADQWPEVASNLLQRLENIRSAGGSR